MINSNDGSYLSQSAWVNDFDLVKNLNSTSAAVRNPLLNRRLLPDDTDINPSPVSSQIGSQDVEMTSKSSFIGKNAPVSAIVPPKKKKVVDITNSHLEDWSHIQKAKEGIFKKSKGKENDVLFDVGYAESDASVMSEKKDKPTSEKNINWSDDSIVSDFTDTSILNNVKNIKENVFRNKQSNGFLTVDDEEIIVRRDVDYDTMHVSITNPAIHLAPKENTNTLAIVNKSIGLMEKSPDEMESIDDVAPEDVSFMKNDLPSSPEGNNDTSISTNLSVSYCYENARKSKSLFDRKKRISFNETVSSTTNEENKVVEEQPSPFVVPKKPLPRGRKKKNPDVASEEAVSSTANAKTSKEVSSPEEAEESSENVFSARKSVFTRNSRKEADFQVEFDNTESIPQERSKPPESSPPRKRAIRKRKEETVTASSSKTSGAPAKDKTKEISEMDLDETGNDESSPSESGVARQLRKSVFARKTRQTNFQVDFEKTVSTPQDRSKTPCSILGNENTPEEDVRAARKSVFTRKSRKPEFQVDFEKTENTPQDRSNTPYSIISNENTPEANARAAKTSVFSRKSRKTDFQVDFEKTESTPHDQTNTPYSILSNENTPEENARAAKKSVFSRKSRKTDFQVDFEKTEMTPQDGSKTPYSMLSDENTPEESGPAARKSVFTRKSRKTDFVVDFEKTESTPQDKTITPYSILSNENTPEPVRKSVFARKSQKADFDVDFEKTEMTSRLTPDLTSNNGATSTGSLRKRKEKEMDTFNLFPDSFEKTLPKQSLFGKKARKNDDFNVSFEESRRRNDTEISLDETDRSIRTRQRKSATTSFQVPPNEIVSGGSSSDKTISTIRRISERNTFGSASERSFDGHVTVIDKTGNAVLSTAKSADGTVLTNDSVEISYDDGNLNGYLSDAAEEESEPEPLPVPRVLPVTPPSPIPVARASDDLAMWELKFKRIVENAQNKNVRETRPVPKPKSKPVQKNKKAGRKTPNRRLKKPADYATKRLYDFLVNKLISKYKTDAIVRAEEFVVYLCEVVQIVIRRKAHQKKLIDDLKKEMAKLNIVETTMDFCNFVRNYLPDTFRFKVIPSVRPLTNAIYPPSDIVNPFDKIL